MSIKDDDPYFSHPALSRSDIVDLLAGPNVYQARKENKKKSDALSFGTAFHMFLLEPERFKKEYAIAPEGMQFNRKDGIEWKKANEGKTPIKNSNFTMLCEMTTNIKNHSWLKDKFENATMEQCYYFNDEDTGEALKSRPDLVNIVKGCIIDFKTARTLNERSLAYEVIDLGYDIQGHLCVQAVLSKTGQYLPFYDVFIEKNPPYDLIITEITIDDLIRAAVKVRQAIEIYRTCKSANSWPSLKPKEPIKLNLGLIEREDREHEESEILDSNENW